MRKLVLRPWLGFAAALATLPCTALGQTPPEPATVPPPAEPAPAPAPPETTVTPAPEPPPPSLSTPTMAPVAPEPAVVAAPMPMEAPAEEEEAAPAPTISGYIEAAYHINFSDTAGEGGINDVAYPIHPYYDPQGHSFVFHGAHLAIAHSFNENISAVIELDAGYDASNNVAFPFYGEGSFFDVQEAYATYTSGIFSMTAGKFVTYEGIEVIEGPLNPTISRGLLYGLAEPFTHTGVKFHFTGETVDFGIGVVNGWDNIVDNNGMKTFIFKLGLTPSESFLANFSGTFGSETEGDNDAQRLSLDLTGAFIASESFSLWYQANFGMDNIGAGGDTETVSWFGLGLQPTYTSESFTFGGRFEIFSDPDGVRTGLGPDGTYFNVTITPGFILAQGFKVRLELRADIATEDYLGKASDPGSVQFSGAAGAEYVF